jgi:hypothetical protein
LATGLFLCFFVRAFILQYAMVNVFKSSIAIMNIINIQMMNKILSLGTSSKKYYETGRIMNFITVDSQ